MIDKNLILYLPFDDPDGSTAQDYSVNRNNATLSGGATFSREAKKGKALALNGGECITAQELPLASDFTLTMFVKTDYDKIGWLLNFSGVYNFKEQWLDVKPGEWLFLAFVKEGSTFKVYRDGGRVFIANLSETPTGLSVNSLELVESHAQVDELQLFDVALNEADILKMQASDDVEYYIDGNNFKDYGVYVSASSGLVGRLAQKDALQVDWDNYHGIVRNKKRKRFKERTINLECFIEASGRAAFIEWKDRFLSLFDGDGTHRLMVEYDGRAKPLVYEVDIVDEMDITKTWARYNDELMVGTFTLQLVEDEPVKKVLRHVAAAAGTKASFTVSTYKLLNVYWGDGTHTFNVKGDDVTVEHTYEKGGEFDIVITGVIEDIEKFETNEIVVWEILK